MRCNIPELNAPLDISWDNIGVPHIFASCIEDAYRGMGYACASERLWQLHLSNLYATGTAASVMGGRFVTQDLMHRVFNVAATEVPESPGDYIVDAYLQGVNAYIESLDEVPAEFIKAGTEPRKVTRHDVASRYRFTGWFQHKSWMEKIYIGKLMAEYGIDWFKNHLIRFSDDDADCINNLRAELLGIDLNIAKLLFPKVPGLEDQGLAAGMAGPAPGTSGSNNWAVSGELSASGFPMLATDPHQPHSIPNTFFYSHLSAPGWDAFGASFPGVPYFMMGINRDLSWGLTTGVVDTYDVFVEKSSPTTEQTYELEIAGAPARSYSIKETRHGPVLESITDALGITAPKERASVTSLDWVMRDLPTSAGALACLPTATTSEEFGETLFERDICPLVNNIICVDRHNDMRRFMATTVRRRRGVTGIVPLPGSVDDYCFDLSKASELLVEHNPDSNFTLTANNDTMGDQGDYPIHSFPASDARARRIEQLLTNFERKFVVDDFTSMQLDLLDLRAQDMMPDLLEALVDESEEVQFAKKLLADWDCVADVDSRAACIFYPLMDKRWHVTFMKKVLGDNPLFTSMSLVAPGLNRFSISDFMHRDSLWLAHKDTLQNLLCAEVKEIVIALNTDYGDSWCLADIHRISFRNSLSKFEPWSHMRVGPDAIGGSPTTLRMAAHNPPTKGALSEDVFHGPAFRWVVDLADPLHFKFVIAGGNAGQPSSSFLKNSYQAWLEGSFYDMTLVRDEIEVVSTTLISPGVRVADQI